MCSKYSQLVSLNVNFYNTFLRWEIIPPPRSPPGKCSVHINWLNSPGCFAGK